MSGAGNNASSQQAREDDPLYNEQEADFWDVSEEEEDGAAGGVGSRGRGSPHDRFCQVLNKQFRQAYAGLGIFLPDNMTKEQE